MMLDNPSLEIEIQGHVNCPLYSCKKEDAEWNQRLSDSRAKAVYSFLSIMALQKTECSGRDTAAIK